LKEDGKTDDTTDTEIEKTKGLDTGHDEFIASLQKGNAAEVLKKEFK